MLRSAPLLRRGALLIRGPSNLDIGPGSAKQREERCIASGTREAQDDEFFACSSTFAIERKSCQAIFL